METVIETVEVKKNLERANIEYHVNEFCNVLAKRLSSTITPLGFLMAFELLCSDMEKGDGLYIKGIGEPIRSRLSGMPLGMIMRMQINKIIDLAFPMEFGQEIKSERAAVMADMKAAGL
jgi:hypothetical protein